MNPSDIPGVPYNPALPGQAEQRLIASLYQEQQRAAVDILAATVALMAHAHGQKRVVTTSRWAILHVANPEGVRVADMALDPEDPVAGLITMDDAHQVFARGQQMIPIPPSQVPWEVLEQPEDGGFYRMQDGSVVLIRTLSCWNDASVTSKAINAAIEDLNREEVPSNARPLRWSRINLSSFSMDVLRKAGLYPYDRGNLIPSFFSQEHSLHRASKPSNSVN